MFFFKRAIRIHELCELEYIVQNNPLICTKGQIHISQNKRSDNDRLHVKCFFFFSYLADPRKDIKSATNSWRPGFVALE